MKNTPYSGYLGPRLPRDVQMSRVRNVIREELTDQAITIIERPVANACYSLTVIYRWNYNIGIRTSANAADMTSTITMREIT